MPLPLFGKILPTPFDQKESLLSIPNIPFVENRGQFDASIQYYAEVGQVGVAITEHGLNYILTDKTGEKETQHQIKETFRTPSSISPMGDERSVTQFNYFTGAPSTWLKHVPAYERINYTELWQDIDLEVCMRENQIEKIFKVGPGAHAASIEIEVGTSQALQMDADGNLVITLPSGVARLSAPYAYQEFAHTRKEVAVSYMLKASHRYGFRLGDYDTSRPVIIDPVFTSTFIGGSDNQGNDIALDADGNVFVTGFSNIRSYPRSSGPFYEPDPAVELSVDIIVSKLSPDLSTLMASTIIGGSQRDVGESIAIDSQNQVFIAGASSSSDFPTQNALTPSFQGQHDAILIKMDNDLSELLVSTYFGGRYDDLSYGMAIAPEQDDIVITGATNSDDFPLSEQAFVNEHPQIATQLFVSRFNNDLTELKVSTVAGSKTTSLGMDVAIAMDGDICAGGLVIANGSLASTLFGDFSETHNALALRFDAKLTTLKGAAILSGNRSEKANAIAVDASNNIYLTGNTLSSNFPTTTGAYHRSYTHLDDVFVAKLSPDLGNLKASTFIGGSREDVALAIDISDSGSVYITGSTFSSNYPTVPGSYDTTYNGAGGVNPRNDVFVSMLSQDLQNLQASTYVGSTHFEHGRGIVISDASEVYITGVTRSINYPVTAGAYNENHSNGSEIFVTLLPHDLSASAAPPAPRPNSPNPSPKKKHVFRALLEWIKRLFHAD